MLLQKTGMPLQTILPLCFKDGKIILDQLEQGRSLHSVLFEQGSPQIRQIGSLCKFLDLEQALEVHEKLQKAGNRLEQKLFNKCLYPLFLFLFSYGLLCFFEQSILPSMMSYGAEDLSSLIHLIKSVDHLLMAGLLVTVIVYGLQKTSASFSCSLCEKIPILARIQTLTLARIFHAFCETGLSSRETLECMAAMDSQKETAYRAKVWLKKMEQGSSLEECIQTTSSLDPDFESFVCCGLLSSSLPRMLEIYAEYQQKKLEEQVKKLALSMELVSYACVGCTAMVVYQMMLVPLNMLSGF